MWHCTRLEGEGEVWCGTVKDWRVHMSFVVTLYKSGKFRRGFVWLYTKPEISSEACCGSVQDGKI